MNCFAAATLSRGTAMPFRDSFRIGLPRTVAFFKSPLDRRTSFHRVSKWGMARSRPELSAGFLLLAKSYRFLVEERIEGLGRVVNNCEEGVSFSRTDDVQFRRGFRRGRHG